MKTVVPVFLAGLLGLGLCGPAAAVDFPPVTGRERSLTSVPGEPNAPAVVLFRKADLLMKGFNIEGDLVSRLTVHQRIKVLTEEGRSWGEVAVPHGGYARLERFEGRTVLPDGRVLPLPAEAKFERKISKRQNRFVTTAAFPGVETGAILDYHYELKISVPLLEPWHLSDKIPVLYSEIVFRIPKTFRATQWSRNPYGVPLKTETTNGSRGTEVRAWAENLVRVGRDLVLPGPWQGSRRGRESGGGLGLRFDTPGEGRGGVSLCARRDRDRGRRGHLPGRGDLPGEGPCRPAR